MRRNAWAAGADSGLYVVDIDATPVGSHSDKQGAAGYCRGGFGFHRLMAYLDATGEALACLLRPGNAAANSGADHVRVLDDALAQLPVDPRSTEVTARTDSAGCSAEFPKACRDRNVRFVVGHRLSIDIARAVVAVPERLWRPAAGPDGSDEKEDAEVAEITGRVDLSALPEGTRMIARREHPHPGEQPACVDADGRRLQVLVTDLSHPDLGDPGPHSGDTQAGDTPAGDVAHIEALWRRRGRAERQIHDNKATGLAKTPSASFAINTAWGSSRSSRTTCSHGPGCSPSTATSPAQSPNGCATACCTPPPASPPPDAAHSADSPPAGPGPRTCSPRSRQSTTSP